MFCCICNCCLLPNQIIFFFLFKNNKYYQKYKYILNFLQLSCHMHTPPPPLEWTVSCATVFPTLYNLIATQNGLLLFTCVYNGNCHIVAIYIYDNSTALLQSSFLRFVVLIQEPVSILLTFSFIVFKIFTGRLI